jgi:hypothetical protein
MNALRSIIRELAGLFVDDKFLAAGILSVAAASWLLKASGAGTSASGALLFFGCLAVLVASALGERRSR